MHFCHPSCCEWDTTSCGSKVWLPAFRNIIQLPNFAQSGKLHLKPGFFGCSICRKGNFQSSPKKRCGQFESVSRVFWTWFSGEWVQSARLFQAGGVVRYLLLTPTATASSLENPAQWTCRMNEDIQCETRSGL